MKTTHRLKLNCISWLSPRNCAFTWSHQTWKGERQKFTATQDHRVQSHPSFVGGLHLSSHLCRVSWNTLAAKLLIILTTCCPSNEDRFDRQCGSRQHSQNHNNDSSPHFTSASPCSGSAQHVWLPTRFMSHILRYPLGQNPEVLEEGGPNWGIGQYLRRRHQPKCWEKKFTLHIFA